VLSCGPAACPSAGDNRPRLSLPSGDSSDRESRQEASEGWGSPVELQPPAPSTSSAPWVWEVAPAKEVQGEGCRRASGIPQGKVGAHQGHQWEGTEVSGNDMGSSGLLGTSQGGIGSIREGTGALWTQGGGQRNSGEARGRVEELRGHLNGGQGSCADTAGMTGEHGGHERESKRPLGTRRGGQGSSGDTTGKLGKEKHLYSSNGR